MYKPSYPWKLLKIAGLGEKSRDVSVLIYAIVLRQKCRLIKDPTSDEMQEFAMNAMFTCVFYTFGNISVVAE